MEITQARVRELFDYQEDGNLTWKNYRAHNAKAGDVAGYVKSHGYKYITIQDRRYLAHRLVFLYHHGYLPPQVDHINLNKLDNRIENLRAADSSKNKHNTLKRSTNTSGFKGVSWCKKKRKWRSSICHQYNQVHLGYFNTPEEAHEAYKKAAANYHGDFARVA